MLAMFSSCWFLPVSFAFIGGIQNSIAIAYSSSAAIPFFSILKVAGLILFIHTPLFVLGNIYGRNNWHTATIPIKINPISQPIIRQKKWYNQPRNLIILGGVLPFVSISVEVYYIFTSFWNYKFYYVYGFGLLAAILLALTVICISIVSTYFILNSEDYRWPWVSFLSSASLGGYIFSYSIYYYFFRTHMTGLLQLAFYFGYTFFISVYLSLVAGAIGYTSAYYFVKILYSNVKPD